MRRMIDVNLINTLNTYQYAKQMGAKKYFCVSTDKAANPANFMGATKSAMEICLFGRANAVVPVSSARFANVAFSQGSLLESFKFRIEKRQPISAPSNIERFFITEEEAGQICLFSLLFGKSNEIYFPFNDTEIKLTLFKDIITAYLKHFGREPIFCSSECEAREYAKKQDLTKYWPVFQFNNDATGEKPFEEFYTAIEEVTKSKIINLAYVKFNNFVSEGDINKFLYSIGDDNIENLTKTELINIFANFVPNFQHIETGNSLNQRM